MLKIKNWKRNRSLPLGIYLLAGLFLFGVESAEAKKLTHERTEYCSNQVYVSNNQGTSLQVQPGDKASSIAQLHYMQYLCVVGNDSKNTEEGYSWIKVKKYLWQSKKTKSVVMIWACLTTAPNLPISRLNGKSNRPKAKNVVFPLMLMMKVSCLLSQKAFA